MKRRLFSIVVLLALAVWFSGGAYAVPPPPAYTPPGPGSVNPPLQPDGIQVPDVFGSTGNWQFSPPLRKFVDTLPGLTSAGANNLNQYIPVANPDTTTFPGSDYYEIEVSRYTKQMHSDLPPTTLQGYRQVNNGTTGATDTTHQFLGPVIVAQKDRSVRIKFINNLPNESVDPFFLPVDTTVMGSGMGPLDSLGAPCSPVWDPRLGETKPNCAEYTKNRAELHLHGGLTPWISDGTPHQWITPAAETTVYPKGTNVQYVPDMWFDANGVVQLSTACTGAADCTSKGFSNNPGPGAQTFYYTNQQSARLMFYHDHSFGITRLNVYAGEAAGYLIRDPVEQNLISTGVIPSDEIPLVIEDKSFVDAANIPSLDPTWVWGTGPKAITWRDATGADITNTCLDATCSNAPGARKRLDTTPVTGDLWWPHVYMPAENPADLGGVNPVGRWVYGMYFWPPTTGIKFLPVANPYYDCGPTGLCDSPWQPSVTPATSNPSWTAEAFLDTQTVNGTAFPKLDLAPKAYRLRILNASHDRFVNLQLYVADPAVDGNAINPLCQVPGKPCAVNTEVKMVPAVVYPAYPDWTPAADSRVGGVPDPTTAGPKWIQIGNEGGFLPTPAVIYNKPISFVLDPTLFNVGNVNDGTIIMGPAERADVIIDFSAYAGKTLILYNDAPAAFPAFVPSNDYYTDAPDLTATGGYKGTKAGTGPNTRTIMQINVAAGAGTPFNETALMNAFASAPGSPSVFQQSQEPIIVGQSAYDLAYNTTFPSMAPNWGLSGIADNALSFETVVDPLLVEKELALQFPMQPKALHDEMGAVWDEYGRMSAKLGVELPNTNNINQIFVMQNYQDPPTELVQDGKVQLWKITHNGVDTHPLHFHLFDVQVINRVGWDGFIRLPWENELGWKETVRVSPLEDTIVALRPRAPILPFTLDDSVRLYQPALPANSPDGFMNLNPLNGQAMPTTNISHNYGAEYVWHCHILSHEEQDMMRPMVFRVATAVSGGPTGAPATPTVLSITATPQYNALAWNDTTYNVAADPYNTTLGFTVERCDGDTTVCNAGVGTFVQIGKVTMVSNTTPSYNDATITPGATYTYRVKGYNTWIDNLSTPPTWHVGPLDPLATSAALYGSTSSIASNMATSVTLNAYVASPTIAPAKFYAQAAGGTGVYQYRFFLDGAMVQDYSVTRFWSIPANTAPGLHTVAVDVRTNFGTLVPDQSASIVGYQILSSLPTVSLIATPSTIAITNPLSTVTLDATATVPTGLTINKVEFYNGSILLGTDTIAPYSYVWTPSVDATYSITAKAYNNLNGASVSAPVTVIVGTGVGLPVAAVSPATLAFGNQLILAASPAQTVTVGNTGLAPLSITSIGFGAGSPFTAQTDTCTGATLATNATCSVGVIFTPTVNGPVTDVLTVNVPAPSLSPTVSLSGTGISPVATLSTTSITFANQLINTNSLPQAVTVSNTGNAPLVINGFSLTDLALNPTLQFVQSTTCVSPLAAGASCTANVTFTPTVTGPLSAILTMNVAAPATSPVINLTGTGGAPVLTVTQPQPATLAFGSQLINTTSPAQTVTVTNTGNSPLTVSNLSLTGSNPGHFAQSTDCILLSPLAANATCTVSVTFTPTSAGAPLTATLNIFGAAPATAQSVALSGTGTMPIMALDTTTLAFGNQLVGTVSAQQSFTVSNIGTAPLTINSVLPGGANPTQFNISNNCAGLTLDIAPPNNSCTETVTFAPTLTTGARSASITITPAAPAIPLQVSLSGTGTLPVLALSPTTMSFGNQVFGTVSAVQTLSVSNTGTAPLTINTVSLTGGDITQFTVSTLCAGAILVPNQSCTETVSFAPTATVGVRNATLTVTPAAPATPLTAALNGTATQPVLVVAPTAIAFVDQVIGTVSAQQTVTMTNTGTGPLTINNVILAGANPTQFTVSAICGGTTLLPTQSCTENVTFAPTATIGVRSAVLTVYPAAPATPVSVTLSGTGTGPALGVAPTTLSFLNQAINTRSRSQTVVVSNTGTAPMTINSIGLSGAGSAQFSIGSNTCGAPGASLQPATSCTVSILFRPTTYLAQTAALNVNVAAPAVSQSVVLSGTTAAPVSAVSPTSLAFGNQRRGTTSAARTVTISNTGTARMAITGITVTGANANQFTQTTTCGTSLAAGASCTSSVRFRPTTVGAKSATLNVNVGGPATNKAVALSGTGI